MPREHREPHQETQPVVQDARGILRPSEAIPEESHRTEYQEATTDKDRARWAKYAKRRAANPVD